MGPFYRWEIPTTELTKNLKHSQELVCIYYEYKIYIQHNIHLYIYSACPFDFFFHRTQFIVAPLPTPSISLRAHSWRCLHLGTSCVLVNNQPNQICGRVSGEPQRRFCRTFCRTTSIPFCITVCFLLLHSDISGENSEKGCGDQPLPLKKYPE